MAVQSKVIMCMITRDEADVLRENLEHHIAEGVTGFIITSHVSLEENAEALKDFKSHIVELIEQPNPLPFPQADWHSLMATKAAAAGAEWIISVDSDEFWHGLNHLDSVSPNVNAVIVHMYEHLPLRRNADKSVIRRADMPFYAKRKINTPNTPKCAQRAFPEMVIKTCGHDPCRLPAARHTPIIIRHYPIRSFERFVLKATTGSRVSPLRVEGPFSRIIGRQRKRERWLQAARAGGLYRLWEGMLVDDRKLRYYIKTKTVQYFDPTADDSTTIPMEFQPVPRALMKRRRQPRIVGISSDGVRIG